MNLRIKTAVHLLLIFLILFGLAWYFMSSLTFFSNDNGLRFIQIQTLVENNGRSFAVSYPARDLDPGLDFTPFYYAYSLIDEEIFLQISSFLPLLTAWLYPVLGTLALPVVPVLGGVLTAAAVFLLGRLVQVKRPYLLMWTAVFATPVFFYSMELWDHTIAVACALWGVVGMAYGLQKERWLYALFGGMALGIGLGQRPEMYVFAIALGVATLILAWRKWRLWGAFAVGVLLTAVPIWYLHWQWTGHPLGMAVAPHLFKYGVRDVYAFTSTSYPRNVTLSWFIMYVQGRDFFTFAAALLILSGIFMTIFSLRVPRWQKSWMLWLAFGAISSGTALMIGRTYGEPIPGIFSTFPMAVMALVYIDKADDDLPRREIYRLTLITTLLFLGLMLAVWPTAGGTQWGARYLLPVYPLFVFLVFYVLTIQMQQLAGAYLITLQRAAAGLLIASVLVQIYSISLLYQSHDEGKLLRNAVENLPTELILTNNPFLPSFMASLDKEFLYIDDTDDLVTLVPRLVAADIDRFALVTVEGMQIFVPAQVDDIAVVQSGPVVYTLEQRLDAGEQNE